MRFRYKGRRYKLNLFPVFAALLLVIVLAVLLVRGCADQGKEGNSSAPSGSSLAAGGSSSVASSGESSIPAGGEPASDGPLSTGISSGEGSGSATLTDLPEGSPSDWNLILLNPAEENKIDTELDIQKTKFDEQWVDSRAASAYQEMCDAAKAEGITLYLRSGYRSIATQETNYQANIQREIARGNNEAEAVRLTKLYYTVPGHSEHHSGLAFDIITPEYHNDIYDLNETFANDDRYNTAYKWLIENCADYGFILRYPKDKTEITDINFEPWHYRYVGVEHAKYIMNHNLCLEEYIDFLKEAGR